MLVKHEFSYDVFHKNGNRVYRIVSESRFNDEVFPNSGVPAPLAEAVEKEISGLETVVAFHIWEHVKVSVLQDGKVVKSIKPVNDIIFTSPDYFHLFSFEWLAGSPIQSLSESYQVVLSEGKAKEYFPYEDVSEAVGKIIMYQDSIQTTVSGIVKDPNGLTDFTFREFISIATIEDTYLKEEFYMEAWDNISSSSQLFVKLKNGVEANSISAQFPALLKKYLKPDNTQRHELQPLSDIHFSVI
jgi:hypothetical protein